MDVKSKTYVSHQLTAGTPMNAKKNTNGLVKISKWSMISIILIDCTHPEKVALNFAPMCVTKYGKCFFF